MSKTLRNLVVFFFPLLIIAGCSWFNLTVQDRQTVSTCVPVEQQPTPYVDDRYSYYIVLIEGSDQYAQYREQGLNVLSKVLPQVLEPGDKIAAIWMEVSALGNDDALFFIDEVPLVPFPTYEKEVAPLLTPTPTPLPQNVTVAARKQHQNRVQEVEQANAEIEYTYSCTEIFPLRERNNLSISKWRTQQQSVIDNLTSEFIQQAKDINPNVMSVFEALQLASDIFQDVCGSGTYNQCNLIILSDMKDWRTNIGGEVQEQIQQMEIDFSNVSIAVVWMDCQFFSDQFKSKCESRLETWQTQFASFGATQDRGNIVFLNQDNVVAKLSNYLGGQR